MLWPEELPAGRQELGLAPVIRGSHGINLDGRRGRQAGDHDEGTTQRMAYLPRNKSIRLLKRRTVTVRHAGLLGYSDFSGINLVRPPSRYVELFAQGRKERIRC